MEAEIDKVLRERGITTRPVNYPWKLMDDAEKWMTRGEAIAWLNEWRKECIPRFNLTFVPVSKLSRGYSSGWKNVYLNGLIDQLIERIRKSHHDPVTVVAEYNWEMDGILTMSDLSHKVTHQFAGFMERASYEVLLFLKEKEKEMNRK